MRYFMTTYKRLKIMIMLLVICLGCIATAAENDNEDTNKNRVSTDLEQRLSKKISVEFVDTPIDDVIRIIADQANVDIVKSPNVSGSVTVTLTEVPLEEALNNILQVHGCTYMLTENMIRVVTTSENIDKPELMRTQTYEIIYSDIEEIVKALEKFKSPQGSLSSVQGTSYIIVTDTESKISEITTLINIIDCITPQILVEARIYDVTSKDRLDLGIEWNAGTHTDHTGGVGVNPTGGRTDPFITSGFQGTTAKAETTTGALRFGWLNSSIDIDMMLRAQQENIIAKLLANPRILVLNNETANIKIVSEIPYQELQESSAGGSVGTTAFREVGVELEVTPHLASRDGMIRLRLKPVFSVVTGEVQVAGVNVTYPQPVVDRREANTVLLIKDGHTVVLGGLRKRETTLQTNKIFFLGDLPLFGPLFRFQGEEDTISELVVFITPWIVNQPEMTEDEAEAYEVTEFSGPNPGKTISDKSKK